jgi:putative ABC transport system permease protein
VAEPLNACVLDGKGLVMRTLLQDLRYAMRMLTKRPGFALVAIFTLALGIGANSAIFSVVNAVLLRPMPFQQPEELVKLWESFVRGGWGTVSVPNLKDWRELNSVFTGIAAYQTAGFSLLVGDSAERIPAATVSANFLEILGVQPRLGRGFLNGEEDAGRNRVVILSDALWQRKFNGDPNIVGKNILLGGENYQVVGVMSPRFRFPSRLTELWVPLDVPPQLQASRGNHWLFSLGRLKPGVTLEQARENMAAIAKRLEEQYNDNQAGRGVRLIPLQEEVVQNVRPALFVLFGAVGLVLLIGCVNVANLLLARAAGRRREIAIRAALGAGRGRLIRQFLTESVLLSVAGGILGLLVAKWGISVLVALASSVLPRASEIALDTRVLGFTFALSILTGIAFGLAPALQNSRSDVQTALKDSGNAGSSPQRNRLRGWLVVAEVSAALVLLIGAGLLLKSFWRLQQMDAGLRPEHVVTMSLALPEAKYPNPETMFKFRQQFLQRVNALPGVEASGMINLLPLQNWGYNGDIHIEGDAPYPPGQAPVAEFRTVGGDYFQSLGIPLVAGRWLDEHDTANAPQVILINQALAKTYLAGRNPIGAHLLQNGQPTVTIVGVVGDVNQSGLTQASRPEIYTPYQQAGNKLIDAGGRSDSIRGMSLVVRTAGEPTSIVNAVRGELRGIDPNQPVYNVKTMSTVIDESVSGNRLNMTLLSTFAVLALLLACIGIYSVMSYTVTQSTREIGIRMALGARSTQVLKLVIGHGLMLTIAGVVIGILGAFALTRLLENLLFGVTARDPLVFASVPFVLVVVALLACYLPARRAMKLDPVVALRNE